MCSLKSSVPITYWKTNLEVSHQFEGYHHGYPCLSTPAVSISTPYPAAMLPSMSSRNHSLLQLSIPSACMRRLPSLSGRFRSADLLGLESRTAPLRSICTPALPSPRRPWPDCVKHSVGKTTPKSSLKVSSPIQGLFVAGSANPLFPVAPPLPKGDGN